MSLSFASASKKAMFHHTHDKRIAHRGAMRRHLAARASRSLVERIESRLMMSTAIPADESIGVSASASTAAAALAVNLALNRPTYASSLEADAFPASYATDGNSATRWSSGHSDPQWIYVDLGQSYDISRVVLNWETAYGRDFQIQVSSDALQWTAIQSVSDGSGGAQDFTGLSGTGRYVRIYGTRRATDWGYSLWEFRVYGTPASGSLSQTVDQGDQVLVASQAMVDGQPFTSAFQNQNLIDELSGTGYSGELLG